MNNLHLIDYLSEQCGCECVSDLKYSSHLKLELRKLLQIDSNEFALTNWNDLINYLVNEDVEFESVQEAKDYLKEKLVK